MTSEVELTGPEFWGPSLWNTIHSMAADYKPENADRFVGFIHSLRDGLLPCPKCRDHLAENLTKYPIEHYLGSNHDLFYWTYILHDEVNKTKGVRSPSYKSVKRRYFNGVVEDCIDCGV